MISIYIYIWERERERERERRDLLLNCGYGEGAGAGKKRRGRRRSQMNAAPGQQDATSAIIPTRHVRGVPSASLLSLAWQGCHARPDPCHVRWHVGGFSCSINLVSLQKKKSNPQKFQKEKKKGGSHLHDTFIPILLDPWLSWSLTILILDHFEPWPLTLDHPLSLSPP